jgi:mRNA interferase RelE/StbE
VTDALERLSDDPRPHGCEKISGTDEWRIRVGDYRIRYTIDDKGKVVIVTRIGHRKKIYEG